MAHLVKCRFVQGFEKFTIRGRFPGVNGVRGDSQFRGMILKLFEIFLTNEGMIEDVPYRISV